MNNNIQKTVRLAVKLLVNGEYQGLAELTKNTRLHAEQIQEGVDEYSGTLEMPPDSAFNHIDIVEIAGLPPKKWSVRFDLWTCEEGRSDLSVEMTLFESDDEFLRIELDGIHVL